MTSSARASNAGETVRPSDELSALSCKEHVLDDHQPVCPQLAQSRKGCIEIAFSAGIQDMKLQAEGAGSWLQTSRNGVGIEIGRVDEHSDDLSARDRVMQ